MDIHPPTLPVTIGVAGGTGSGKTTIALQLLENVGEGHIAYLPHDAYYYGIDHMRLSPGQAINYDHPDSLETSLLIHHIQQLKRGLGIDAPEYDFSTHTRHKETRPVTPQPIILVEGILIFVERALRDLFDIKIYVDADADIRFIRRLQRDTLERGRSVESIVNQYLETVRPMHLKFVEPSKRHADVIIPEGGYNQVAIGLVVNHIRNIMRERMAEPQDARG